MNTIKLNVTFGLRICFPNESVFETPVFFSVSFRKGALHFSWITCIQLTMFRSNCTVAYKNIPVDSFAFIFVTIRSFLSGHLSIRF